VRPGTADTVSTRAPVCLIAPAPWNAVDPSLGSYSGESLPLTLSGDTRTGVNWRRRLSRKKWSGGLRRAKPKPTRLSTALPRPFFGRKRRHGGVMTRAGDRPWLVQRPRGPRYYQLRAGNRNWPGLSAVPERAEERPTIPASSGTCKARDVSTRRRRARRKSSRFMMLVAGGGSAEVVVSRHTICRQKNRTDCSVSRAAIAKELFRSYSTRRPEPPCRGRRS